VFGQDRGNRGGEVRRVVEVFDDGAVDAEDVLDPGAREVLDDEVCRARRVGTPSIRRHIVTPTRYL